MIQCPEYHLALWEIRETIEELGQHLNPSSVQNFAKGTRNLQWLASRKLIQEMLGLDHEIEILKTEEGKPYLSSCSKTISMSHSGHYAAAIISNNGETGVDIEKISDRIFKIVHKFVNESEGQFMRNPEDMETCYLIWSAKEVLFKYHGFGALDFRKHLSLTDLHRENGTLKGVIQKEDFKEEVPLRFKIIGDYFCTWVDHQRMTKRIPHIHKITSKF